MSASGQQQSFVTLPPGRLVTANSGQSREASLGQDLPTVDSISTADRLVETDTLDVERLKVLGIAWTDKAYFIDEFFP